MLNRKVQRADPAVTRLPPGNRPMPDDECSPHNAKFATPMIWQINLATPKSISGRLENTLSAHEQARAARYVHASDRNRYMASHAALRHILAAHLGTAPSAIAYDIEPRGRPILKRPQLVPPVSFSLSHSGDHALVGITNAGRVGVDIEVISDATEISGIARRHFTDHEADLLFSMEELARRRRFHSIWTRKEAYLKAIGVGLQVPLSAIECELDAGDQIYIAGLGAPLDQTQTWSTFSLDSDTIAACAVIEGVVDCIEVHQFDWS